MIALQQHVQSLEEKLLRKDTGISARGSCDGRPYTPVGVEEHVESIVTPPMGRQVNIYLHYIYVICLLYQIS